MEQNDEQLTNLETKLRPEYKKMLNNLLGIRPRDNAVFTNSKVTNIDLARILTLPDLNKILTKEAFRIQITAKKSDTYLEELQASETAAEFLQIVDHYDLFLAIIRRKNLERDFDAYKESVIQMFQKQKNLFLSRWKSLRNKYLDQQVQTNSWPLYIGTMVLSARISQAVIHAPLLFKKVKIEITSNNKVFLQTVDDGIDLNAKLVYFLQNEWKINLPTLDEEAKYSFLDVMNSFRSYLKPFVTNKEDLTIPFCSQQYEFCHKSAVKNLVLQHEPGVLLTFQEPSGGNLRDKMISLLKENKADNILEIKDPLLNIQNKIKADMQQQYSFFRINQTDISQEKAIIGALQDSACIWGPPGTGKSQTICNIIANLLANNKKVIITSEKKAALDVIKERCGTLAKYMCFSLVTKDIKKADFYEPFQQLLDRIVDTTESISPEPHPTITNFQLDYLQLILQIKKENLDALTKTWKYKEQFPLIMQVLASNYKILHNSAHLQDISHCESYLHWLRNSNIKKKFFRYPHAVNLLKKFYKKYGENFWDPLCQLLQLKDLSLIDKADEVKRIRHYYHLDINDFKSDEVVLDHFLAYRFRQKMLVMNNNKWYRQKIRSFIKNCRSAFRVPYKFINIHREVLQNLFDIFISTPNTLSETINWDLQYDYAIFDEASQLHLEKAFPYLGIADKVVIAGDNQQMRPTSYFAIRDNTELSEENDENVDSLLDFAYNKGFKAREYMLSKNYRSRAAELMLFSSSEFYNANLDTIDNYQVDPNNIEVHDVNGEWDHSRNEIEAKALLDRTIIELANYDTLILLTLNAKQKQLVETSIYSNSDYNEIISALENGRVKLRNLENIQGDEADLVLVSVGYDKSASLGATYVGRPQGRYALNVAISRAIKKIIIFKSIYGSEVSITNQNESLTTFKKWLSYLDKTTLERKDWYLQQVAAYKPNETFESDFEENVYDYLRAHLRTKDQVALETQFPIGSYRIDIVIKAVTTGNFLLGIEVDGYKYHSGFDKMLADIERQSFIEAKGYPIYRISELNWRENKKLELDKIATLLNSGQLKRPDITHYLKKNYY